MGSIEKIQRLEQQLVEVKAVQTMVKEWLKTDKEADAWFDSNYSTQSQLRSAFLTAAVQELENEIRLKFVGAVPKSQFPDAKDWSSTRKIKELKDQILDLEGHSALI